MFISIRDEVLQRFLLRFGQERIIPSDSVQVGVGGYSVSFNESIEIAASDLKEAGELLH